MSAERMVYLTFAAVLLAGIALTGFDRVHWLLLVPLVLATFAGLTGVCVNLRLQKSRKGVRAVFC